MATITFNGSINSAYANILCPLSTGETTYTFSTSGTVNYTCSTYNSGTPGTGWFGYVLNGQDNKIRRDDTASTVSYSGSFTVNEGDVLSFRLKEDQGDSYYCYRTFSGSFEIVEPPVLTENIILTENPLEFTLEDDLKLTANFRSYNCTITTQVNPSSGGTATGSGKYAIGDSVILSAVAANTYKFVNWELDGEVVSTNPNYVFTIAEDTPSELNFLANFVKLYTVTITNVPATGGSVTGWGSFAAGEHVKLTAIPNQSYMFKRFYKALDEDRPTITTAFVYEFDMPAEDVSIGAKFIYNIWEQNNFTYTIAQNILSYDGNRTVADVLKISEFQNLESRLAVVSPTRVNNYTYLYLKNGYYFYCLNSDTTAANLNLVIDSTYLDQYSDSVTFKLIVVKNNSSSYKIQFYEQSDDGPITTNIVMATNAATLTAKNTFEFDIKKIGNKWLISLEAQYSSLIPLPEYGLYPEYNLLPSTILYPHGE